MLIGYTTRPAFNDTSFSWWYDSEYKNYDVDIDALQPLFEDTTLIADVNITIVMGTWCSDSRREVPRFLKIIDGLNFPQEFLTIYSVDRNKTMNGDSLEDLNIELIPTFIFFRNGIELGRIVEAPIESLEIDMVKIITAENEEPAVDTLEELKN